VTSADVMIEQPDHYISGLEVGRVHFQGDDHFLVLVPARRP
jgi:hypothetical protein